MNCNCCTTFGLAVIICHYKMCKPCFLQCTSQVTPMYKIRCCGAMLSHFDVIPGIYLTDDKQPLTERGWPIYFEMPLQWLFCSNILSLLLLKKIQAIDFDLIHFHYVCFVSPSKKDFYWAMQRKRALLIDDCQIWYYHGIFWTLKVE